MMFSSSFFLINVLLVVYCRSQLLVDQLRWDFLILEDKLWKFVLEKAKNPNHETDSDPDLFLLKNFQQFDQKLQEVPEDILYGLQVIQQTRPFLFLFSDLRVIDDLYDKFRRVQNTSLNKTGNEEYLYYQDSDILISQIVNDVLYDPKNNVGKIISNIQERVIGKNMVISEIFEIIEDNDYNCKHDDQPPQQVIYNLYNVIALIELKGYVLTQFSYMTQRLGTKGNHTGASVVARKEFEKRFTDHWIRVPAVMEFVSATLWRCDPKSHSEGRTYDQLTGLIQGHIENEVDMNGRGTCTSNCQGYSLTRSYGCYDDYSEYCQRRKRCGGQIISCRFIESDMTACIAPSSSPRRYQYVQYKSGRTLGMQSYCTTERSINSWWRWFVHCSYCFCLCDSQGIFSDRYFNLRPVMADVKNNRVVTGLRLKKHNRIIHLQIQEGKLLPYGYIDNSTVRWVPIDNYQISDIGIQNGEDFYTMDYKSRSLFLDVLQPTENDHVVTGIQFEQNNGHLRLKVNVRGFNFTDGKLSKESYDITGVDRRQQIELGDADIPTNGPPSKPVWPQSDQSVEFTHSSIVKDAAQTTVPFFDAQPVAAYPAVPLRGAGIYYKGTTGYGGFVAPKIITFDFYKHLQMRFPEMAPREDNDYLVESA